MADHANPASGEKSALLGYLNFAEGRPDPRFHQALNDLPTSDADASSGSPLEEMRQALTAALAQLHQGGASAFRNVEQAQAILRLTFDDVLPAYRRHHADLLAHLGDADLLQPFFLARVFEAVLQQRGPWDQTKRIVDGALKQLNDYVGHRPIAMLESRPQGEPYDHERVRPFPLYLRGAGVARGRYRELITQALEILQATDAALLRGSHFDFSLLDELALDPRAYDFHHPADKRPNYVFGEWDPHGIDGQGRYRRFVVRDVTLEGLWQRVQQPGALDRQEALTEAAAVLAGTMLMAAGVSGSGPEAFLSNVTLSTLFPQIAKQRDAFYRELVPKLPAGHRARLEQEAKVAKQPFGAARQALNQFLAQRRALQLQYRRLALFFADLGDAAASRRQLAFLTVPSARMLTELQIQLTAGRQHVERGRGDAARACLKSAEQLLERGIACGAFVDPWNILGFQGQFPRFRALEDSVRDHRIADLTDAVAGIFDLYNRLLGEGAPLAKDMRRRADWWDKFATTTVSDVPHVHGRPSAESAVHVAQALSRWRERGAAAGDLSYWREHIEEFHSPRAFGTVIEALLQRRDFRAAAALLVTWLGQAEQMPLEDDETSFFRLALRWLLELANSGAEDAASQAVKFFAYLEANAEDWWQAPTLDVLGTNQPFPPMPKPDDDDDDSDNSDDSLYGAAYEDVTYRGSTDDGVEGEVLDFLPQKGFDLEHEAERLWPRLRFLACLARCWIVAGPLVRPSASSTDQTSWTALGEWLQRAEKNHDGLLTLLDIVHAHAVPKPTSAEDALVEFSRRSHIKDRLLSVILEACREHTLSVGLLRSLGAPGAPARVGPPWESALLAVERHLRHGESAATRIALAEFKQAFRDERLLYTPLVHGGDPRTILQVGLAHAVLNTLAAALPRQGLLRECWLLLRLARSMEAGQTTSGPSVTEFHRPFQTGLQGVVEAVLAAALRDGAEPEAIGAGLETVVEPFLPVWIDHFQTTRLSVLEAVRNDDDGRRLEEFIRRYGRDLFTRRFLDPSNLSGVLQRGIDNYLSDLRDQADPLHPIRLVDELDRPGVQAGAERWLRLILETLLENRDILRDYQQTCTQADFGDNLHLLLDFLRLKAKYERAAWNYRPLHFVHDVLVRRHPPSAALWRDQVRQLTREPAQEMQTALADLEQRHGMRLATVRDRIDESFVQPLEMDRLAALVEPALAIANEALESKEPGELEKAVSPLAAIPAGAGLDVPPWLARLENELDRLRQAQDPLARLAEARFQVPMAQRPFVELIGDFEDWEQAAD